MLAARLFRALLWTLPAPFRHEFGTEMELAFRDELREAGASRVAQVRVIWRAVVDLLGAAPKEHYHVLRQDVRYSLRALAAQPTFTAVVIVSLALGIGANVALYSLVEAIQFRSLPVRDPQELVLLTDPGVAGSSSGSEIGERSLLTYEEFLQLRTGAKEFQSVMAVQSGLDDLQVRVNGREPETIRSRMVSAEYFPTLGVPAIAGRTFGPLDGAKAPLAVLSHDYWQRRFGGQREAIGGRLVLRDGVFTIAGVMPPGFFGETVGSRPDVWLPLDLQPVVQPGRDWLHDSPSQLVKNMWLHVFGRVKPGVSLEQAQSAVNVLFQQGLQEFYASAPNEQMRRRFLEQRLRLRPAAAGASSVRRQFGEPLTILLAVAALVLLIACANLGNLLLARATARTRELAVRLALGAGRGGLIRQMITESMLLALAGGIAGLGGAWLLRAGLLTLVPGNIQVPQAFSPAVAGFAFAVTIAVGLLLSLLPALRALHVDAYSGIKEQGRGLTGSAAWVRTAKVVVVGQLALSLPLLIGAGLLIQTLRNLQQVDLGYAKDNLLQLRMDVRRAGYAEPRRQALFERLHARVRAVPGVLAASYSQYGMLIGGDSGDEVLVEGYTRSGGNDRGSAYEHVGPGFFSALGVPLRAGREIEDRDHARAPKVCVINEAFAKRFFANRNPIGLHVTQLYGPQRNTFEVVGVAANSRRRGLRGEIEHRYYVPAAQPIDVPHDITLVVRAATASPALIQTLRAAILSEDPELPITAVRGIKELVEERTGQDRLLARLALLFGAAALVLTAVGLYGVLSYGVARRTSEIGIRKALGAQDSRVVSMILRETGWLVVAGLALGGGMAWATLRLIETRLYGLAPSDPGAIGAAAVVLTLVALLSAWLPARRASRVDPLAAIRYE